MFNSNIFYSLFSFNTVRSIVTHYIILSKHPLSKYDIFQS
ncbi:hypothetical protein BG20_I0850 [Candidatus Nitrosarchaeum limnium BG20]|uniref:Uncharacterized protein n=1 Tax=Candidatus Nitrosarchaeum limnium BG20 TaxID=859192 RepID=S2E7Q0_9ARCH|nr:hypothetical protein BG20_I0850 [Candidatus Nitrosarchaeum limnium BG20]